MDKDDAYAILSQHNYHPIQLIRQKTSRYPLWHVKTSVGDMALKIHPEARRITQVMRYLGETIPPQPCVEGDHYILMPWLIHEPNMSIIDYQHMIPIIQHIAQYKPPHSLAAKTSTSPLPALKNHIKKKPYYQNLRHQLKHPPTTWQKSMLFSHHDIHLTI